MHGGWKQFSEWLESQEIIKSVAGGHAGRILSLREASWWQQQGHPLGGVGSAVSAHPAIRFLGAG